MKLYNLKEFIKLPSKTIFSKVSRDFILCSGLYCKVSESNEYINDFNEQNLICEVGYPNNIDDGMEALIHQIDLRDNFKDFRTDLDCAGRNGSFDDKFVVWDKSDIKKLYDYLGECL